MLVCSKQRVNPIELMLSILIDATDITGGNVIDEESFKNFICSYKDKLINFIISPFETPLDVLGRLTEFSKTVIWYDGRLSSGLKIRIISKEEAECCFDKDGNLLNAKERYENRKRKGLI